MREKIRTILHDFNSSEKAIGICGIPGSGKTTLAQYVYQSEKEGGYFDLVMSVHLSVDAIFRQMFEAASPDGVEKNACPPYSLETLRTELVNKLQNNRLLLVLDEIWPNKVVDEHILSELISVVSPSNVRWRGSKILVTSRTESALQAQVLSIYGSIYACTFSNLMRVCSLP